MHAPSSRCNIYSASESCKATHKTRYPLCTVSCNCTKLTQHTTPAPRHALLYDLHDQLISYEKAWSWQRQRLAELCAADCNDRRDTVFLLQHPPVYTLGAGSSESHVKFDLDHPPYPLYRTERGGEVTYHGPGQLVMYPILDLSHHTQDLHWYLRGLEEVIIRALADTSGLQGVRIPGLTGVWVDGHKLAAIGVRARKWITYHGLALNVSTDLQPFKLITPCGIEDRPVGSVKTALEEGAGGFGPGQSNDADSSRSTMCDHGSFMSDGSADSAGYRHEYSSHGVVNSDEGSADEQQLSLYAESRDPLLLEYRYALLEAFEDVFGLQLQPASSEQMQQLLSASTASAANATKSS